jgi:hypothetical protein
MDPLQLIASYMPGGNPASGIATDYINCLIKKLNSGNGFASF